MGLSGWVLAFVQPTWGNSGTSGHIRHEVPHPPGTWRCREGEVRRKGDGCMAVRNGATVSTTTQNCSVARNPKKCHHWRQKAQWCRRPLPYLTPALAPPPPLSADNCQIGSGCVVPFSSTDGSVKYHTPPGVCHPRQ